MTTVELRPKAPPALQLFIVSRSILPEGAYPIRELDEVPGELRRLLTQAADKGIVWACWVHAATTWLFTAEMSLPLSRERGTPVLHIRCYRDDTLEDSGTWTTDLRGNWHRCTY